MRIILDTSFILKIRKSEKALELLKDESKGASDIGISILSLYELEVGSSYLWLKRRDYSERSWLKEILRWLTIYRINERSIKRAAMIKARALARGESYPDMDLLIATTISGPAKLLSCDEDHFKMAKDLEEFDLKVVHVDA